MKTKTIPTIQNNVSIPKDELFRLLDTAVDVVNQLRGIAVWAIPSQGELFDWYETDCPTWDMETKIIYSAATESLNQGQYHQLLAFLEAGVQAGILCYRRLPAGFDWSPADEEKYEQFRLEFQMDNTSFGVWRRY